MIKVKNLTKSYNGEPCLRGIDLSVQKGEFIAVAGESGSGKTTLLEILAGVRTPDGGSVNVCGEDVFSLTAPRLAEFRRTKIGVVYQNFGLIETLTAEDNIKLPLMLGRADGKQVKQAFSEVCARLGINGIIKKYPGELSGGQRQRVAIARAVIYNPQVLFLDEPTASLDSANSQNVLNFISEYNRERGATVFMITHSDRAAEYASRKIKICDGLIVK